MPDIDTSSLSRVFCFCARLFYCAIICMVLPMFIVLSTLFGPFWAFFIFCSILFLVFILNISVELPNGMGTCPCYLVLLDFCLFKLRGLVPFQERSRRKYVLKHIIHKKVLSQSKKANDDTKKKRNDKHSEIKDDIERGNNDTQEVALQGENHSSDESCTESNLEDQLVLPHEEELSFRFQINDGKDVNQKDSKDNIYVESLRSIRANSSFLGVPVDEECHDSLYSPQACPICLEDYKKGDDIAWSKNEKCHHAYHVDCIMEWLMKNNDCPMCREQYVELI